MLAVVENVAVLLWNKIALAVLNSALIETTIDNVWSAAGLQEV